MDIPCNQPKPAADNAMAKVKHNERERRRLWLIDYMIDNQLDDNGVAAILGVSPWTVAAWRKPEGPSSNPIPLMAMTALTCEIEHLRKEHADR